MPDTPTTIEEAVLAALAYPVDINDRDSIARARHRVGAASLRVRVAIHVLAYTAKLENVGTLHAYAIHLERLFIRGEILETMAQVALELDLARNMPGAVLDPATGRVSFPEGPLSYLSPDAQNVVGGGS